MEFGMKQINQPQTDKKVKPLKSAIYTDDLGGTMTNIGADRQQPNIINRASSGKHVKLQRGTSQQVRSMNEFHSQVQRQKML